MFPWKEGIYHYFTGDITIYLMSGESSTPGGALDSISRVGEACCIQIGRNDVFLECFHERKGSITTQQKFEEKGLIVSTLLIAKKKMTHPNASHSHWFILPPTLYQPRHIKTWIDEENVKLFVFVSATTPVSKYVLAQTQNEDKTCPSKYRDKWVHC